MAHTHDAKYQALENELRAERERRLAAERRAEVLEEATRRPYGLALGAAPSQARLRGRTVASA